jgi:hypothetical protein
METSTLTAIELRLIANAIAQTQNAATGESNLVGSDEQQYIADLITKINKAK